MRWQLGRGPSCPGGGWIRQDLRLIQHTQVNIKHRSAPVRNTLQMDQITTEVMSRPFSYGAGPDLQQTLDASGKKNFPLTDRNLEQNLTQSVQPSASSSLSWTLQLPDFNPTQYKRFRRGACTGSPAPGSHHQIQDCLLEVLRRVHVPLKLLWQLVVT